MESKRGGGAKLVLVPVIIILFLLLILFNWTPSERSLVQNVHIGNLIFLNSGNSEKSKNSEKPHKNGPENCETPECVTLAHQMLNWGDKNANPCDDFYQYTCGRYAEHDSSLSSVAWKDSTLVSTMTDYFAKNASTTSKSESVIKQLYTKCKERKDVPDAIDTLPVEILESIKTIGSWPMLSDNWTDSEFNLNRYMENMARHGIMEFAIFKATPHEQAPKMTWEWDDGLVKNHKDVVQFAYTIIYTSETSPNKTRIQEEFDEVGAFMKKLKKIPKMVNKTNTPTHSMTTVDLDPIFKAWMGPDRKDQWQVVKNRTAKGLFNYFGDEIDNLIRSTPPKTLANLMILRSIVFFFKLADQPLKNKCGEFAVGKLPRAATRIFFHNFFDKHNIELVSKMVDGVKNEFVHMLNESTWLHQNTKREALLKIEKMKSVIGYPEEYAPSGALDKVFEACNTTFSDSIHEFFTKLHRFSIEQKMQYIINESSFSLSSDMFQPNAFYQAEVNLFFVLIPYMDEPLFDASFPQYAKIARVGSIIGHEIGHAFDTYGAKYDGDGVERDWWNPRDMEEFANRSQCLIEQYESHDDPSYGRNLIGSVAIDENMADLIGMEAIWRYYKRMDMSKEQSIVGYNGYSFDKMFFQLIAMNFCASFDTLPLEEFQEDPHPTSNFRVNGVFANLKSFSDTFNCPAGSPMNPEKKCSFY